MGEKAGFLPYPKSFDTICIHHSLDAEQWKSKSVIPQIVPSTIFKLDDPRVPAKYTYSRMGNPSRMLMEQTIAVLNKGKYGLCWASGISAITGILAILRPGDHLVCSEDVCPDTYEVFKNIAPRYKIQSSFVDICNTDNLCKSIKENTKLIWVENPMNVSLKVVDLCAMSSIAKEKDVLLGVDNTFLTPFLQAPLEFGADIAMQSLTKYVNGHSDVIMGSLCVNCNDLYKELYLMQAIGGLIPSPFDCYQALRGIKTLPVRMEHFLRNSVILANFLGQHSAVKKVIHTGLKNHPHIDLLKTQSSGPSPIISVYLKGGLEEAQTFLKNLKVFTVTEVCGGTESTAQSPFLMSHKCWEKEKKEKLKITENLIKLSVGLEYICDLICDVESALDSIKKDNSRCS